MRFVYVLLIGVGFGMVVAGNTVAEPPPPDPARSLAEALKRLPPDHQASAELTRLLQSTVQQSLAAHPTEWERSNSERMRTVSALLDGFGSGFLVIGSLGLLLSLYGTFERRLETQRAAATTTSGTP